MNIFSVSMRFIVIYFFIPFIVISQEFYPGFLEPINNPICYNTAVELNFETLPSGTSNNTYNYQWQISLDQLNWADISEETSTTYFTENLESDTHYRVLVTYENSTLPTNTISVWVLPELSSDILTQPNTFCDVDEIRLDFYADGAEWWWGGMLNFSYQWQQNTIKGPPFVSLWDSQKITGKGWVNVGEDLNYIEPSLEPGMYYFRCMVTSPYGCGTIYTNTAFVEVKDCSGGRIGQDFNSQQTIIGKTNILGATLNHANIVFTIYSDGLIKKEYILQ